MLVLLAAVMNLFGHEEMTLEEKVGQVLMVHFHGETVNDEAKALVQETKIGAIIYYNWSNGLHSVEQVRELSVGLQELTQSNRIQIPLLIAVDQEGGRVARLRQGFTQFPSNQAVAMTHDPNEAENVAWTMGKEMLSVGINMNLAPVVDVNSNPQNSVLGDRCFGRDPERVIAFGKKALAGYRRAGVISTLKHFPGYGDVSVDPHADLPINRKTFEELKGIELLPFAHLAPFADAIMTAHILVPELDPENCSTLSEGTLSYLRDIIGFRGVIISDSLVMRGVIKECHTVDEAAIRALNAGCDLLILGGKLLIGTSNGYELKTADVQQVARSLVDAVRMGRIPEERLNQAVDRVLQLKAKI